MWTKRLVDASGIGMTAKTPLVLLDLFNKRQRVILSADNLNIKGQQSEELTMFTINFTGRTLAIMTSSDLKLFDVNSTYFIVIIAL